MAGKAGKKARVKVATVVGGPYNVVLGIDQISFEIDGQNVDVSEMGDDYVERVQGMKDVKLSLSGNVRTDDANGQSVIKTGFLNDTTLFFQVLPDNGVTAGVGAQFEAKVSKYSQDFQQAGKGGLSIDAEGNGGITAV
jgi:predicted secreted protein